MKFRIYCEKCEKEYLLESGEPWVGLMACPHELTHHILKEVMMDEGRGDKKPNTHDTQNHQ